MPRSRLKRAPAAKQPEKSKRMPPARRLEDPKKRCRPAGRTMGEFGRLSVAEKQLINCCRIGQLTVVSKERPTKANSSNRVRASLIRFLALGGDDDVPIHEYGVMLSGAWITGVLKLEDAILPATLALQNCRIQKIDAWRATIPILVLTGSHLEKGLEAEDIRSTFGLWMHNLTSSGPIGLRNARLGEFSAFEAKLDVSEKTEFALDLRSAIVDRRVSLIRASANATVTLDNSTVKGDLECMGAQLRSKAGFALRCDGVDFGHNVYLRDEFRADGGVRMIDTRIGMTLDCSNANFEGKSERALECERTTILGPVFLNGSHFVGSVNFHTAAINGPLLCRGTHFEFSGEVALDCSSASIGYVDLTDGFSAKGQVSFESADIKGNFNCNRARLDNPQAIALNLDDASITLSVTIADESHLSGTLLLSGAKIGRNFECSQTTFDQPPVDRGSLFDPITEETDAESISLSRSSVAGNIIIGSLVTAAGAVNLSGLSVAGILHCHGQFTSLSCRRASVSSSLRIGPGFTAVEEVSIVGARIGGDLVCSYGQFQASGVALDCENVDCAGNVWMFNLVAVGTVSLNNAVIGKSLMCNNSEFQDEDTALSLESARVAGTFFFQAIEKLKGAVSVMSAHVGALNDDLASWSGASGNLFLDGFTYDRLAGLAPTGAKERVAWLRLQWPDHLEDEFRPQPWEQLIVALRASGHPINARKVAIARNDQLRRAGKVVFGARALHWLYGKFVGYGYKPVNLLGAIVAVWLICAGAYWLGAKPPDGRAPLLQPSQQEGKKENTATFSPLFYSADVLLPIVDLGYSDSWVPDVRSSSLGGWLRTVRWLEIIVGWLFGGVLAAMLTQLVKRD